MSSQQKPKKEYDMITARKIINEYADKVNLYMKENSLLQRENDDLRITLKLNKDLMFKYVSQNLVHEEQLSLLKELKSEGELQGKKVDLLNVEKIQLEKKVTISHLLLSFSTCNPKPKTK